MQVLASCVAKCRYLLVVSPIVAKVLSARAFAPERASQRKRVLFCHARQEAKVRQPTVPTWSLVRYSLRGSRSGHAQLNHRALPASDRV